MLAEPNRMKLLFLSVIFVLIMCSDCASVKWSRRKSNEISVSNRILREEKRARNDSGRGLFFRGGLLSFSKVLNFFPVGGERECQPTGYNVARAGICLNAYDCRQRDGKSAGDCAHGLGVCCVFEISCGGSIQNNLTYFMSPGFPEFWTGDQDCNITIDKTHAGVMQLRIDLLHFSIGQPNRTTGECDEDALILGEGESKFSLCGQNHGQHLYYTLSTKSEVREAGELASEASTTLSVRMRGAEAPRIWLMRFAQMPLAYSAPHGCLQYFTGENGTIKTFNYATNGRHLAGQEYKSCIRRNKKKCSVRYKPCDARSFRIGSGEQTPNSVSANLGPGAQGGSGTGFYGPDGSFYPGVSVYLTNQTVDQIPAETNGTQDIVAEDPVESLGDEVEGSGDVEMESMTVEEPSMLSRIWTYITSWWGQSGGRTMRWSPYAQHYREDDGDRYKYYGYGDYAGKGYGRLRCQDRVTISCENEYFVSGEYYGVGVCDPHHCGNNFCPGLDSRECAVESSITPFEVSVHFGPATIKRNPEENIGMCLRYYQMPCDS